MELRQETKRFVAVTMMNFLAGVFCNMFKVCHQSKEIVRNTLAQLALGSSELEDLKLELIDELATTAPGLEYALESLGLNHRAFIEQAIQQSAFVSLAHIRLLVEPKNLEQAAAVGLKISALIRQQIMEILDRSVSKFARVQPPTQHLQKRKAAQQSSWKMLFQSNRSFSEFEHHVTAASKQPKPVPATAVASFLQPANYTAKKAKPAAPATTFIFDPSKVY
jgi:hypothetical protein